MPKNQYVHKRCEIVAGDDRGGKGFGGKVAD